MQSGIRQAAVAGMFYPGQANELAELVDGLLAASPLPQALPRQPCAFVVPHAGLVYSGPIAALVYRQIAQWQPQVGWRQCVILGPNHRVPLSGMAGVDEHCWRTPLGDVAIAGSLESRLREQFPLPARSDAHQLEHCIEVQLPFLQRVLPEIEVLPLLVGQTPVDRVASLIQELWRQRDVLVLISSDLSHFHIWREAQRLDAVTTELIEQRVSSISPEQACGCHALNGLLQAAREMDREIRCLGQNTSGDTAGDKDRVVGYGAYVCY